MCRIVAISWPFCVHTPFSHMCLYVLMSCFPLLQILLGLFSFSFLYPLSFLYLLLLALLHSLLFNKFSPFPLFFFFFQFFLFIPFPDLNLADHFLSAFSCPLLFVPQACILHLSTLLLLSYVLSSLLQVELAHAISSPVLMAG